MSAAAENIDYKALYEQLLPLLKSQQESNLQLQNQVTQLQYQLHQLTKLLGGFKSERFIPSGSQGQQELGLDFEKAFAATNLSDVQKVSYVKTKQTPRENGLQNPFPEHLRVEEQVIEPDEDVSHCEKNGEDVKEQLGWKPGEIFIKRTVRSCYKCPVPGQPGQHSIVIARPTGTGIAQKHSYTRVISTDHHR